MTRPDAFAAVMATGIVSIAAADHGFEVASASLAVAAAVALPVLVYATVIASQRESWDLRGDVDVAMGLLTYVAACCVLAARFDENSAVVVVLGGLALVGWLSLFPSSFVACGVGAGPACGIGPTAAGSWPASRRRDWPSCSWRQERCSGR